MTSDTVFVKTVRNSGLFMLPREARIHKIIERAQDADNPITPKLIGYRWKGFHSDLRIERIPEKSLRSIKSIENPGALIANVENMSAAYLKQFAVPASAHLDFYSSGGNLRHRYDVLAITRQYRLRGGAYIALAEDVATSSLPALREADHHANGAERVVSHLDYYAKNFISHEGRLYLIDWGEGYIGRRGFDLGAYLMVLLRLMRPEEFLSTAATVVRSYMEGKPASDTGGTYEASNRILLPRSLSWLLQDKVEQQYDTAGKRHVWQEKLSLLKQFAQARSWRDLGLLCLPFSFLRNLEEKTAALAFI